MNSRVTAVQTRANYTLELTFTNDEVRLYDCSPILDFGVFQELKNKDYFKQAKAFNGTVCWPNEQDICPDTLYLDSVPVAIAQAQQA
ncbi:MAG: DUF2442 domain-containing protein [Cyanophyceae cyanobacterium]